MNTTPAITSKSNRSWLKNGAQKGATLIEILVAVLILSVGTLGMAGLQARALKGNVSSLQRSQAVMLATYMMEMLRVDPNSAKALNYNTGTLNSNDEINGSIYNPDSITGNSLFDANRKLWLTAVKQNIGTINDTTTKGAIFCDAVGNCRVQVIWDDSLAGGLGAQKVEIRSSI
ncbi:type IV pilus modification protein PilV [Rhodoferax aquaticus]|uniref:Type IV pilus modification protein PilV n=1 Tax=Rhodoferax aquaticus TaxID=2527691 RepID=A0A515ENJ3_9BURK|nr:type IV pilus modification protein PilV [Rhodoferax aquaticus]QDL54237.1 type IV pilus modification protein PilV [Rhodoferax aquaticus]